MKNEIQEAKKRLPLPELFARLGIQTDGRGKPKKNPLRPEDKNLSFSVFEKEGQWFWKDHKTDETGDEITFLEKFRGIDKKEAVKEFLALAGNMPQMTAPMKRDSGKPALSKNDPPLDWKKAVADVTPEHLQKLANWRGYSQEFCQWLHAQGMIGIIKNNFCFPVHDPQGKVIAAHIRLGDSGKWKYYPAGRGVFPLIIADPEAKSLICFESQWDMFAFMDQGRWDVDQKKQFAFIATRGKSNGKQITLPHVPKTEDCFAVVQNDQAGQEWLESILEHYPGKAVVEIRPAGPFKDLNDQAREEGFDSWELLKSGTALEKPRDATPQSESIPVASPQIEAIADEYGFYWQDGSDRFYRRGIDGKRFSEVGRSDIRLKLKTLGFASRAPEGETASFIDKTLIHLQEHRAVDWSGSLAGHNAGLYHMQGKKILVKDSPRIIEPIEGDWLELGEFLRSRLDVPDFGKRQLDTFFSWCKFAYESLINGEHRPGQALILCGQSDSGKSRLQHQIITPLLGGRYADPAPYLIGKTDFNSELIGSEHLLIEDMPSSVDIRSREYFGEMIKNNVVADGQRAHKKQREAITLSPYRRLSISVNDNPDRLKVLPPVSSDLKDKMIMLMVTSLPFPIPAGTKEERKIFRETILRQLPAFCHFLLHVWKVPDELEDRRFGVRYFHHPAIISELMDNEPDAVLLALLDQCLFEDSSREEFRGTAVEIQQKLTADDSPCQTEARKLFAYSTHCGVLLGRLRDKTPARVNYDRSASRREWIIKAPPES